MRASLLAAALLTCAPPFVRPVEPPGADVLAMRARLATEKRGTFLLKLRLHAPAPGTEVLSTIHWQLRMDGHPFAIGFEDNLDLHLDPGVQDLPVFELPFALEDARQWSDTVYVDVTGRLTILDARGQRSWLEFERPLAVPVEQPQPEY